MDHWNRCSTTWGHTAPDSHTHPHPHPHTQHVHNRLRPDRKPSVRAQYACYLPQMQLPRSHVGSTGGSIQIRSHVSWGLPDRQANEEATRWDSMRPALRHGCAAVVWETTCDCTCPQAPLIRQRNPNNSVEQFGRPIVRQNRFPVNLYLGPRPQTHLPFGCCAVRVLWKPKIAVHFRKKIHPSVCTWSLSSDKSAALSIGMCTDLADE